MKARILNNKVIEIFQNMPLSDGSFWVDCPDNAAFGWDYNGEICSAPSDSDDLLTLFERKINALWESIANNNQTTLLALKAEMELGM